jgi:hypothetical protein
VRDLLKIQKEQSNGQETRSSGEPRSRQISAKSVTVAQPSARGA